MGITYIAGTVRGPRGERPVTLLIDSGTTYTVLPLDVWQAIGLTPKRTVAFSLADGSQIERQVSECYITLEVGDGHTPVILGEPGDEALLGVVTLENLGLVFNPFNRTLHPMRMLLV
ncbi:MAG TPA: retroviral-like aspartic protease family protein [Terriglobia bacterium]|nr:retroviral-like aspartic protease family protein [Terriglobia bacterium]